MLLMYFFNTVFVVCESGIIFLQKCSLSVFPKKHLTGLRVQFTSLSIASVSLPATQFDASLYKPWLIYIL